MSWSTKDIYNGMVPIYEWSGKYKLELHGDWLFIKKDMAIVGWKLERIYDNN